MKYVVWVCDKCGEEVRQTHDQMPRNWIMVNISSSAIKSRSYVWCSGCENLLQPLPSKPREVRRIKVPEVTVESRDGVAGNLVDIDEDLIDMDNEMEDFDDE